ncbi:competence/damage-inducible protein A [Methylococcus capsulatus]|jgi:nicotinamide-nucleotide amidase|uniref:CinA-like protein n=1 Tax=Methylococcus capsulatus TaxID=414 RepID=A0AA35US30_METCP|nr:molybdopterin-binding protein [Methylococcus capsulatus]CAI8727114.1 CinA-like protein [Methylococcus capsulatus]
MTQPQAEILSQGDELVMGQIADTNGAWLSERLTELGFAVTRHTTVGDEVHTLTTVLREIAARADLCVCTGGLGPTLDDLTAEAVAQAFARPLKEDPEALRQIQDWFAGRADPMPAANRKQAFLPEGSRRLDNLRGTAPGFALDHGGCRFFFLPGVPHEMEFMFERLVKADIQSSFPTRPMQRVTLRVLGVGESTLQQRLDPFALPPGIKLGFRTVPPENHVKLLFPADFPAPERDLLIDEIRRAIGTAVFSIDTPERPGGTLIECVDRLMRHTDASLATLETVSRGHLAQLCGAFSWWTYGLVVPDGRAVVQHLELSPGNGLSDGPLDVAAIATHLRRRHGTSHALACMESPRNPSELVIAVASEVGTARVRHSLAGNPGYRRALSAALALDFLRRSLPAP